MLHKYYTCDCVNADGKLVGSLIQKEWFFVSAFKAYDKPNTVAQSKGCTIVNFRRIK